MSTATRKPEIEYPDSDGEPIAENTLQYRWVMTLSGGLMTLFRDRPDVFVAGDLLWYPVEGDNKYCLAPDAMVVFGRPKGDRGSYMQWREENIPPQVAFEVLSPGNRAGEMRHKHEFYERHGVEEYYIYDPDRVTLEGYLREADRLGPIAEMEGWTSPRLGIRFLMGGEELQILRPDGRPFLTYEEQAMEAEQAMDRADHEQRLAEQERARADQAVERAEQEQQRAEQETSRAERLAAQLRALGIDPEA